MKVLTLHMHVLQKMAQIMKLDTRQDQLWKDKAMVELNAAVLHSYNVSHSFIRLGLHAV